MEPHGIVLRTERLLLRAFQPTDADDVLAYASDREWSRFLLTSVPYPYHRADAEAFIQRSVQDGEQGSPHFAMVLDGTVVGAVRLRFEADRRTAELGYGIARELWGQGLTVEAARAVVEWGFEKRGLDEVFARCDVVNTRSARVLEKLGMTREGDARQETFVGRTRQLYLYRLLRGDWRA